jgi:hypothetical protein
VKLKPKVGNKPLHYFILPERDKPGSAATVSFFALRALVQFDGNREVSGICGQTGIRRSYYHRPNSP